VQYNLGYFLQKNWSFVLIKKDKIIFKSKLKGLDPLVFCIKKYKKEMRGAVIFDKIVGRAAACLLAYTKVKEVWTPTISRDARRILAKTKIKVVYKREVKSIMDRKGSDLCPMEKLSRKMKPAELIKFLLDLRRKKV